MKWCRSDVERGLFFYNAATKAIDFSGKSSKSICFMETKMSDSSKM
jgi:hypothetical protein